MTRVGLLDRCAHAGAAAASSSSRRDAARGARTMVTGAWAESARRAREEVLDRGHVPNLVRTSRCQLAPRHDCQGMHVHPMLHTNSCIAAHATHA